LKGVKRVEKGFRNLKEINTVYYDPTMITIEEMEATLKKVGTYRGTEKAMMESPIKGHPAKK
jgi:hypothetical protein